MDKCSDEGRTNPKPEDTRCGGPDDTRTASDSKETPPKEQDNVTRGVPEPSRPSSR